MAAELDLKPTSRKLRNFLLSLSLIAAIFAGLALLLGKTVSAIYLGGISAYSLLTGIIFPIAGALIYYPWILLGWILAHTISPLVIGLIFYLVVTPTGLIMKISGRDRLMLKKKPADESYWHDAIDSKKEDFERMF